MIQNIILMILDIIIPMIILINPIKNKIKTKQSIKEFIKQNKCELLSYLLLVIGCMVRNIAIATFPLGFGGDEASAGYEAYSIYKYGVDRNLKSYPMHFIAWGSGQNVLYSYIAIPFIAIFGLSVFSFRLPMATIGCATLFIVYYLCKNLEDKKIRLAVLFTFVICPWHIMKSRWALESNLFPDLFFIGFLLLYIGLNKENMKYFYIGSAVIGISAYSYGTSYFFIFAFMIISLLTLLIKKKIKIKNAIISLLIIGIIVIPIILFLGINTFDKPEIKIGNITIPRLTVNRYQEVASVFSKDFFNKSLDNFKNGMKIIATQSDGTEYNTLKYFGVVYLISIPFMILGIIISFSKEKRNRPFYLLLHSWLISSLLFLFICEPNINRCNIIMFLMIIYTAIGLSIVVKVTNKIAIPIIILYIISFILFNLTYFNIINKRGAVFESDLQEMVQYVSQKKDKKIYVTNKIKDSYIYFLFFNKENPFEYRNTAGIVDEKCEFQQIYKYKNYVFYIPEQIQKNSIVVFDKNEKYIYDETKFKKTEFKRFIVLESKNEI